LIKHVLDRKMKKEDNEGVKSASVADDRVAPVLSPDVAPGNKAIEAEGIKPTSTGDRGVTPVLSPDVELGNKAVEAEGIKPTTTGDSGVAPVLSSNDELGNKPIEAEAGAENGILVLEAVEAYCVKCRQKRPIQGARKVTTKKGRPAIEGTCAVCDTKLFRFIAREKENLSGEG
jgi:hypothetical protein